MNKTNQYLQLLQNYYKTKKFKIYATESTDIPPSIKTHQHFDSTETSTQTEVPLKSNIETQTDCTRKVSVETTTDTFFFDSPTKSKCRDLVIYAPPIYHPFSSIYIKQQQFNFQYLISQAFKVYYETGRTSL